jgi:hypothetical protein
MMSQAGFEAGQPETVKAAVAPPEQAFPVAAADGVRSSVRPRKACALDAILDPVRLPRT